MSFNRVVFGKWTDLTEGHEFFVDQVRVVSAIRVCRGGASANGVRKSDGEYIVKVALDFSGEAINEECDVTMSSFSRTTSINRRFP